MRSRISISSGGLALSARDDAGGPDGPSSHVISGPQSRKSDFTSEACRKKPPKSRDGPPRELERLRILEREAILLASPVAGAVVNRIGRRDQRRPLLDARAELVGTGQIGGVLTHEERVHGGDARWLLPFARGRRFDERDETVERELFGPVAGVARDTRAVDAAQGRSRAGSPLARAPYELGVGLATAVKDAERQDLVAPRPHDRERRGRDQLARRLESRVRKDERPLLGQRERPRAIEQPLKPRGAELRALPGVVLLPSAGGLHTPSFAESRA